MLDLTPDEWNAVHLSIKVGLWAMAASLPFGIGIALLLARGNFWGKSLLNGVVHLPLVLPPVVTGYLLLLSFGRRGPIGSLLDQYFGIVFSFRWTGAALACAIMGFPLMVRAIRLSIEAVDRRLESAAGTLGASPLWVFATVTLPLILPGVVAGMILSFAKAMGEFGATITFVSMSSIFRWKGRVQSSREGLLIMKTSARRYPALAKLVQSMHSYEVPEIIALSIDKGLDPYLEWVHKETATD